MKLFFYDLETTGLNPARNGIHQISGEIFIDGDSIEKFDFKVCPNPKCTIEQSALDVGHLTKEQILAYPTMSEVYKDLVYMLGKYVDKFDKKDKFFLVGYNNAAFDDKFFRGFFLQNGDSYFGSWFWSGSIDVMVLAANALVHKRHLMENFKLSTVAKYLGIKVDDDALHDAFYDIYLTKEVYEIVKGGPTIDLSRIESKFNKILNSKQK